MSAFWLPAILVSLHSRVKMGVTELVYRHIKLKLRVFLRGYFLYFLSQFDQFFLFLFEIDILFIRLARFKLLNHSPFNIFLLSPQPSNDFPYVFLYFLGRVPSVSLAFVLRRGSFQSRREYEKGLLFSFPRKNQQLSRKKKNKTRSLMSNTAVKQVSLQSPENRMKTLQLAAEITMGSDRPEKRDKEWWQSVLRCDRFAEFGFGFHNMSEICLVSGSQILVSQFQSSLGHNRWNKAVAIEMSVEMFLSVVSQTSSRPQLTVESHLVKNCTAVEPCHM